MAKKNALFSNDNKHAAVGSFGELVGRYRFPMGSTKAWPLTNFTFFVGAGFSKSWNPSAPVGDVLFQLNADNLERVIDPIVLSRLFGVDSDEISPAALRQIVYQLDMYDRYPDVCSRYIDHQNANAIRAGLRAAVFQRYSELADLNFFDSSIQKFPWLSQTSDQTAIVQFFAHLHRCADGSQSYSEGIRNHFLTTNYDYVIETIMDNILAPDDSHFLYTYRGFTPSKVAGQPNPVATHQHWLSRHLIKLNGGFEILRDGQSFALDYSNRSIGEVRKTPPVLMLPSREQDYSDFYFRTVFPKAVRLLRETKVLVLVGYSLPEDDALMRFVLRQFAEEPEDGRTKVIFYVDPHISAQKKLEKLHTVFPSMSGSFAVPNLVTYEGTFAEFAGDYVARFAKCDLD